MRLNTLLVRNSVAFAAAPIAPGLLYALPQLLTGEWRLGSAKLLLAAAVGYPAIFVFGTPILWWMGKRFFLNAIACVVLGMATGFVTMVAWGLLWMVGMSGTRLDTLVEQGAFALIILISGPVAGLVFWAIARPDHFQIRRW